MASFTEKTLRLLAKIPKGRVTTYSEIARALGNPRAARAVGNACNKNFDAPRTPCHRVVGAGGSIGGYAFGVKRKISLLAKEGVKVRAGKILDFEERVFRF